MNPTNPINKLTIMIGTIRANPTGNNNNRNKPTTKPINNLNNPTLIPTNTFKNNTNTNNPIINPIIVSLYFLETPILFVGVCFLLILIL